MLRLFLFIVFVSFHVQAFAESEGDWAKEKEKLGSVTGDGACQEKWNILWDWSKRGNLEARYLLFLMILSPPEMDLLIPPGYTNDIASRNYHLTVLATHLCRYVPSLDEGNSEGSILNDFYIYSHFDESGAGKEFLKSYKAAEKNCADIAVQEGLVPSFDDYTKQIDRMLSLGKVPSCVSFNKEQLMDVKE